MIKLVTCDIDETLLDKEKKLSLKNIEAIKRISEKGVYFVLATGRGYTSVDHILEQLGLNKPNCYTIACNGGVISENKTNRHLEVNTLSFEQIQTLFEFGRKHQFCIEIFTPLDTYGYFLTPEEKEILYIYKPDGIVCEDDDISCFKNLQVIKMMYNFADMEAMKACEQELSTLCPDIDISYSSGRYMELNPKGVSKGSALKKLANYLNIDIKDTLAIGDNYNDISMLKAAGIGSVVSNASDDIKVISDYVGIYDHCHDGVAYILDELVGDNDGCE